MPLQPHPLALEYPRATESEFSAIEADMRQRGYDERFPVVMYGGFILDGITRNTIAEKLGLNPYFTVFEGSEDDAAAFVVRANEHRRHLSFDWLKKKRADRVERMVDGRAQGKSIRRLAEEENVSVGQVQRDLETPGVSYDTPEPPNGKIKGKDGKEYTATPAKSEPILCDRCKRDKRIGNVMVKSCPMCKEIRSKKEKPAKSENIDDKPSDKDAFGTELPKRCRDAYLDPWIQDAIDYLGVMVTEFWQKRLADGMTKRKKHYPFFNVKDFVDGFAMAGNTVDQLIDHLKENRPAGVCPMCEGKGCCDCQMSGLVPRKLYGELKKKAKAK